MIRLVLVLALALPVMLLGCAGQAPPPAASRGGEPASMMDRKMDDGMHLSNDPASAFGPLEVGADWSGYTRLTRAPFESPTHGGRRVEVWVNAIGLAAYQSEDAEIPVGTVVVKTSIEPSGKDGPIFVMEKRAPGFNPEQGDWWYAIHWAEPAEGWIKKGGGPIYWRTPSAKAEYCFDCHDSFERQLGGIPAESRAY